MAGGEHAAWLAEAVQSLRDAGPEAVEALEYIARHRIRLGVRAQPTGARWTADGRIELNPHLVKYAPTHPDTLGLIIHEVRHLQQGPWTALSVYGELDAWQLQFRFLKSRPAQYNEDGTRSSVVEQLVALPLDWDRQVLAHARALMRYYAGERYRIDLLPLYPLPREIAFRLLHRQPHANPN
jgi:hypothetical protein